MFLDEAKITVKAGKGGDGAISFRREKYVPYGGPDGGKGGKGGDVILLVDRGINNLNYFFYHHQFKAENGERGSGNRKTGANGKDQIILVPCGVEVYDENTGELIVDLVTEDERFVIARGGRGGRGNSSFVKPTIQTPRIAEKGEEGALKK